MITQEHKDLMEFLEIDEAEMLARFEVKMETSRKDWEGRKSEADFYKTTAFYLYDLVQYQADPGRQEIRQRITRLTKESGAKSHNE